jgi:hypothetical protein
MRELNCNRCSHTWDSAARPGITVRCPQCGHPKKVPQGTAASGRMAAGQSARPDDDDDQDHDEDLGEDQAYDEDPGAAAGRRDGAAGGGEPRTTHADVMVALARLLAGWNAPPARQRPVLAREITIRPDQVIGRPAIPGRQPVRRPALSARPRAAPGESIEIYGVTLSPHMPPTGEFCEVCPDRTGGTASGAAIARVKLRGPAGPELMVLCCYQCAVLLHNRGLILEPPARLPRHPV